MHSLEEILSKHPFLAGLEPRHLQTIVGCASNRKYDTDEYLAREGQQADSFFLLRAGKVALQLYTPHKGGLTVATLEEGDMLGWSWLVAPYRWQFDARAIEPVRTLVLDGKCLRNKCEQDHELGYQLLTRFSTLIQERLESTRLQLMDVYGAVGA